MAPLGLLRQGIEDQRGVPLLGALHREVSVLNSRLEIIRRRAWRDFVPLAAPQRFTDRLCERGPTLSPLEPDTRAQAHTASASELADFRCHQSNPMRDGVTAAKVGEMQRHIHVLRLQIFDRRL